MSKKLQMKTNKRCMNKKCCQTKQNIAITQFDHIPAIKKVQLQSQVCINQSKVLKNNLFNHTYLLFC